MSKRNHSVDTLTIKHFWDVSSLFKRDFVLSWLTVISALGVTIIVPYFIGKILGGLAAPDTDIQPYVYGLVAASILSVITNRVAYSALFRLQPKAMAYLQKESLVALLGRSTGFHANRVSGKLVSDASDYPTAYNHLSGTFFIELMPFVLIIFLGITLVILDSILIGTVITMMTILAVTSALYFRKRMTPARHLRHAASKAVTAHLADTIINNQTVKSFGNENRELQTHDELAGTLFNARTSDWRELAKDGSHRIFGLVLFQTLFILIVVHQVRQDPTLLSTGIFAFSYTVTLSNRLFQIGTMMRTIEEALLLAMPMTEMLQEKPEIQDKPGAVGLTLSAGKVAFKKVTFRYADNPKHDAVFRNLHLTIEPGEKVGLVGPSGGGKSTLTKLLLRFEDIQSGSISIDGQDIAAVTQTSLRTSIAYVPQEPLLFHRTIKENIAYGHPDTDQKEIEAAARQAYAHEFILKLPQGYETVVGERGVKLSGGQRQRIAIARAILKDAPLLVLDEATSALDSESEHAIQAALWELMQGRTAVVVAHRLSTIQRLDRIIVLDGGSIVEQGTHKELLQHKGLYARLWEHQSGGFIEE